ncbi:MAG: hypothetical protein IPG81_07830 [Sandaracinaceae bacterium]|jgi:hypothetical protein|nr:hypothetical protein [Sandaracinaceae bacterium]MBK7150365.1 hypothetical protein [Sandaracinaceae bacterium]MBP7684297.1 hypothetical protein [Deltaproteobacteria bacterium]
MADQHHDEPDVPGLPQIQDEAADTPMWLPATGLGLLVIMVLMLVYHVAQGPETAAAEGDVAAEGAEAEGGEGAEGEAEAEPEGAAEAPAGEAAPAEDDHAGHGH